jgi:hypothetical protein
MSLGDTFDTAGLQSIRRVRGGPFGFFYAWDGALTLAV